MRFHGDSDLLVGDRNGIFFSSNRNNEQPRELVPGIYGLSNATLNTPWPKVSLSKDALTKQISGGKEPSPEILFQILNDRTIPDDDRLPSTGVGLEWERVLSTVFIESPDYGTRSSTLLFIDHHDHVAFFERTFNPPQEDVSTVNHMFDLEPSKVP